MEVSLIQLQIRCNAYLTQLRVSCNVHRVQVQVTCVTCVCYGYR